MLLASTLRDDDATLTCDLTNPDIYNNNGRLTFSHDLVHVRRCCRAAIKSACHCRRPCAARAGSGADNELNSGAVMELLRFHRGLSDNLGHCRRAPEPGGAGHLTPLDDILSDQP